MVNGAGPQARLPPSGTCSHLFAYESIAERRRVWKIDPSRTQGALAEELTPRIYSSYPGGLTLSRLPKLASGTSDIRTPERFGSRGDRCRKSKSQLPMAIGGMKDMGLCLAVREELLCQRLSSVDLHVHVHPMPNHYHDQSFPKHLGHCIFEIRAGNDARPLGSAVSRGRQPRPALLSQGGRWMLSHGRGLLLWCKGAAGVNRRGH